MRRRRGVRRQLVVALLGIAVVLPVGGPARAQLPMAPEQLLYEIRTVFRGQERWTQAAILAPVPVDVDGDVVPDVVVQVTALPATPVTPAVLNASVSKLPTIPAGTLSVEAVFAVDGGAGRDRLSFGYMALEGVPESFSLNAVVEPAGFTLQMNTTTTGASLYVLGSLYRGSGGVRADAKQMTVGFRPVPSTLTVGATTGWSDAHVQVTSSVDTGVDAQVSDVLGAHRLDARGVVYLPAGQTQIDLDTTPGAEQVRYLGAGTVGELSADVWLFDGPNLVAHVRGRLTGIEATDVRLGKDAADHMALAMNAPIGRVEIGVGLRRDVELMSTGADYLKVVAAPDGSASVAARVDGLRSGALGFGSTIHVAMEKQQRPFRIEASGLPGRPDLRATVQIDDLPSEIDLRVSPASNPVFSWSASGPIARLETEISDSAPLFGRVKLIRGLVSGVPSTMSVSLAPSGRGFDLDAGGGTIGLVDAVLTSGPDERLPADRYGVLVRDNASTFTAAVRLGGLKKVGVRFVPGCAFYPSDCTSSTDVIYDSTVDAGTMWVALRGARPDGTEEQTDVTVTGLPRTATFSMRERVLKGPFGIRLFFKRDLTYTGSAPGTQATFGTVQGRAEPLAVTLAPLPSSVALCMASDGACVGGPKYGTSANKGSIAYTADQHATLNLIDASATAARSGSPSRTCTCATC